MLTIVCWKWRAKGNYRSYFGPESVNTLRNMIARHLKMEHEFVCITDDPEGIDKRVRVIPLWETPEKVFDLNRFGPDCTRRLRLFDPRFASCLGDRIVSLDLDCIVTGSLDPLFKREEPLVLWGDTNPKTFYNGSMMLLSPGAHPELYDEFDPAISLRLAHQQEFFGSDQAWISYRLGKGIPIWTQEDGVYSFRIHMLYEKLTTMPQNCRIVFFHGRHDPWSPEVKRAFPWLVEHWR